MNLAQEMGLPVIIHDRDAHEDTLKIIKEFPKVIGEVHCFSGSAEFAKECVKKRVLYWNYRCSNIQKC